MKKILLILTVLIWMFACQKENVSVGYEVPEVKKVEDFVDQDGKVYKCIEVDGLIWMAENLARRLPLGGRDGCFTYNESLLDSIDYSSVVIDPFDDNYFSLFLAELKLAHEEGKISEEDWQIIEGISVYFPVPTFLLQIKNKAPNSYDVAVACKDVAYNQMYEAGCQKIYEKAIQEGLEHFEEAEAANGYYTKTYGYLYTYDAAKAAIPEGWRLPSDEDWKKLERALGMSDEEIEKQDVWRGERQAALLKEGEEGIGFAVRYGGARGLTNILVDNYINLGQNAYFWCSDMVQTDTLSYGLTRNIAIYTDKIMRMSTVVDHRSSRPVLYSVRCVKDKN